MLASIAALQPFVAAYQLPSAAGPRCVTTAASRPALFMQAAPAEAPKIDSADTYNVMMRTLMETEESIASEISSNYAMIDYGFLQRLEEEMKTAEGGQKDRMVEIQEAVNSEMATRMQTAMASLKDIIQSPTAIIMEGKIAGLARQGKIDDALYTMLEANLQQAEQAGEAGKGAVQVLGKLKDRVRDELDSKVSPTISFIRQLFRIDSKPTRLKMLKEKLSPKSGTNLVLAASGDDGGLKEDEKDLKPDIDPRELAAALSDIKLRFGNVDENYDTGFVERLNDVANEAEEVTLDLAGGKELTARDQQDMAWEKETVSVWDLGAVEEQSREEGGYAYWEKEAQDIINSDTDQRKAGLQKDGLITPP